MLLTALEQPDPVFIFEHAYLYSMEGPQPEEGPLAVDISHAAVREPAGCQSAHLRRQLWKALQHNWRSGSKPRWWIYGSYARSIVIAFWHRSGKRTGPS